MSLSFFSSFVRICRNKDEYDLPILTNHPLEVCMYVCMYVQKVCQLDIYF